MNNMRVRHVLQQFFIAVVVFSLLCPGSLWAKRKGAQMQITKLDGDVIEGELLRVKEDSLLIMTSVSGNGVTVDINEIEKIKIKKRKMKGVKGALIGGGVGFLIGGVVGGSSYVEILTDGDNPGLGRRVLVGGMVGLLFAVPGTLVGGTIGGMIPGGYKTETIDIKRKHPSEIELILMKLKKKARFRD